jgi:hypothetical protein
MLYIVRWAVGFYGSWAGGLACSSDLLLSQHSRRASYLKMYQILHQNQPKPHHLSSSISKTNNVIRRKIVHTIDFIERMNIITYCFVKLNSDTIARHLTGKVSGQRSNFRWDSAQNVVDSRGRCINRHEVLHYCNNMILSCASTPL